jgi:hypothetical protein
MSQAMVCTFCTRELLLHNNNNNNSQSCLEL